MKKVMISLISILSFSFKSYCQDSMAYPHYYLGPGIGIDYGGAGLRFTFVPIKEFALFGAGGFNLVGLGYNAGAAFRLLPDKKFCPYVTGMYGYNGIVFLSGESSKYNKAYYGPSTGLGIHMKTQSGGTINFEVIYPFRPSEFDKDWDIIKQDPEIGSATEPLPVIFSLGYQFML